MAKIKIFKFAPESEKAINELLQTVNLLKDGIFITDNHFGLMYKERDEVGVERENMGNPVSFELGEAQKKFISQLSTEKYHEALEAKWTLVQDAKKKEADVAADALKKHRETPFAPVELQEKIQDLQGKIATLKKTHNKKGDKDKETSLKEFTALEAELKPLLAESTKLQKEYDAEGERLNKIIGDAVSQMTVASENIKNSRELKEAAIQNKEDAIISIQTRTQFLKDLNEATFDKETNLLEFKKKNPIKKD